VRERDYFYAFSFVFYTIFVGVGAYAFLRTVIDRLAIQARHRRTHCPRFCLRSVRTHVPELPRRHAPRQLDPGRVRLNMLVSCPGDHAVLFTNATTTLSLWFMQTVPSRVAGYDPKFGKNVRVGIFRCSTPTGTSKQLKRGARRSRSVMRRSTNFRGASSARITGRILLEDIMIRDMVATAGGVELKWPDDYASTSRGVCGQVFCPGYHARTPVYFATTFQPAVSRT